jgi:hypothetical protein
VCSASSCTDGLKNGSETGVDCGGACTATCVDNTACLDNTDCTSGFCDTSLDQCKPAHCNNGSQDGGLGETGIDCGGSCRACITSCTNGVKDGSETDIDCGGGTCPDCFGAKTCSSGADCVSATCTVCPSDPTAPFNVNVAAQSCRVNAAIDRLYASAPRIKTFVVGFQISGNTSLNCDAVHGKTARRDVVGCDALTRATCGNTGNPTCYYDASDPTALKTAFDDVIKQVSSCRFTMSSLPPDPFGIFVYLQDPVDSSIRVPVFGGSNWHYDFTTNQIEFFGTVCDEVKSGAQIPIVIYGCAVTGG